MSVGPWQLILIVVVVLLLFGGGRVSGLMGDVAKGIKSFKKGLEDDDGVAPFASADPKRIEKDSEKAAEKSDSQTAASHDEQKLNS